MTRPRRVLPGRTYLLTRRCSEQRFFLRPDPPVRQIFEYVLGLACEQFEIHLHAYVVMSNHYHLVVTDPHGHVSDFEQYLNSLVARAINRLRGRTERFWAPAPYNGVDLLDEESIFERLAYVHANPVKARLVDRACHWKGATSADVAYGSQRTIERPTTFFSASMPHRVTLKIVRPMIETQLPDEALNQAVNARVRAEEQKHGGLPAMGMRAVLRQHWNDAPSPTTESPSRVRPTVAASCPRLRARALLDLRAWHATYKSALRRFCDGIRDVVFPAGTYWMHSRLGCNCVPP